MDDDLGCCGNCCVCCCLCGPAASKPSAKWYALFIAAGLTAVGVARPVRATVKDASLARLDLAGGRGSNGTSLAYDLSLTVVLRNRNWAMRAELTAPLDSDLRFAGRRSAEEFRVLAVSSRRVALGSDAVAEFARERVAWVFELELKLAGEVRLRPVHVGGCRGLEATCPVKLLMAPASSAAPGTRLMVFNKVIACY